MCVCDSVLCCVQYWLPGEKLKLFFKLSSDNYVVN